MNIGVHIFRSEYKLKMCVCVYVKLSSAQILTNKTSANMSNTLTERERKFIRQIIAIKSHYGVKILEKLKLPGHIYCLRLLFHFSLCAMEWIFNRSIHTTLAAAAAAAATSKITANY